MQERRRTQRNRLLILADINWNQFKFQLIRLILNQTKFSFVRNQSENDKFNPIPINSTRMTVDF